MTGRPRLLSFHISYVSITLTTSLEAQRSFKRWLPPVKSGSVSDHVRDERDENPELPAVLQQSRWRISHALPANGVKVVKDQAEGKGVPAFFNCQNPTHVLS